MPNVIKGEIPLKLSDGREFVLVFGMEAMIEAEGLYRKPVAAITQDAALGYAGAMRALFYGMLKRRHPEIKPVDASDLMDSHMAEIDAAMDAAQKAALPGGGKDSANPPPKKPRGKTSGRSGAKQG